MPFTFRLHWLLIRSLTCGTVLGLLIAKGSQQFHEFIGMAVNVADQIVHGYLPASFQAIGVFLLDNLAQVYLELIRRFDDSLEDNDDFRAFFK
jgi:hypothetical protein